MSRKIEIWVIFALIAFCVLPTSVTCKEINPPETNDVIAMVNGDPITMEEFRRDLIAVHKDIGDKGNSIRKSGSDLLDRMINAKLIVQEGKRIGLDILPEVKRNMDAYEKVGLRDMLYARALRNVKIKESEIEKVYRENVMEITMNSVLLEKEKDAIALEKGIRKGGGYEKLVKKMVAEGKTKGNVSGRYVKISELSQDVGKVVSKLKAGEVSPIIKTGDYFTIIKVDEIRFPENQREREKAKQKVVRETNMRYLAKYKKGLWEQYVRVDEKKLSGIDYESKEKEFPKFYDDNRVIAEIKGGPPVTVGRLTKAISEKLYHGEKLSQKGKKYNGLKENVLKEILFKEIIELEAYRLKINKQKEYIDKITNYQNGLIFGIFIKNVIYPEIKINEKEIKKYYEEHITDYNSPGVMTLSSLVFGDRSSAESAFDKLQKGSDFRWIMNNATGQIKQGRGENRLSLNRAVLATDSMNDSMRKAVEGAKSGDYRFYADETGNFHVLYVQEAVPPKPRIFNDVKTIITEKIFQNKADKLFEEWVEKLRSSSEIKIFASEKELLNFTGR